MSDMPSAEMRFRTFIDDLLLRGFDQFVTLYYPGPRPVWEYADESERLMEARRDLQDEKRRAARARRFQRAQECYEQWLAEIREKANGNDVRYISAIERRASRRDFMFHVLLGGCNWNEFELTDWWKPRWKELSGGTAFPRQIDKRVGGLLRYFVFKVGCVLEVDCGNLQRRFTASDFEDSKEWTPY
jgi:hypothetical protein